jgi:CRP-like cAMP-binding protein
VLSLPATSRQPLLATAERVHLEPDQVLIRNGEPYQYAYFPLTCILSVMVLMEDGSGIDAATIGCEGMVDASLVLGAASAMHQITVQVGGEVLRVPAPLLMRAARHDDALRDVLRRFVQVLLFKSSRNTACNGLHTLEQRLARRLLHTQDWSWQDHFRLTQDHLAQMLGVRRPSITAAAQELARLGLIAYRRGEITILDRDGLEQVACEDYAAIREAFEDALPIAPRPVPITRPAVGSG